MHEKVGRAWLGFDPGLKGAMAAILQPRHGTPTNYLKDSVGTFQALSVFPRRDVWIVPMPLVKLKSKEVVDGGELARVVESISDLFDVIAYIEHQQAHIAITPDGRRRDTPTTTMSLGMSFQACISAVAVNGIPWNSITPTVWMKHYGIKAGEKKAGAKAECARRFPQLDLRPSTRAKNPHEGYVDALLLAEYCRQKTKE